MKKKAGFLLSLLLCLSITLLVGCGQTEKTYGGYSAADLQSTAQNYVDQLAQMDDATLVEGIAYYESQGITEIADLFSAWLTAKEGLGAFAGYGEFTVEQAGKTYIATQTVKFEQRDVLFTMVYKTYNMEVSSLNFDPVYSVGEKMSKAGLNTVMGILIVFAVLVIISLIISSFKFINAMQNRPKKEAAPAPAVVPAAAPVASSDECDDEELIAVIASAIAAATGRTTDDFVVRSIRRR